MTANEDKPVDREAWRRLLDGDGEGPPELTDARIRARARRAITPRTRRWWLPASLAASLLLAVVIVQWQYVRPGAPPAVVSESDFATAPAEAPAPAHRDEQAPDQSLLDAPATPTAERSVPQAGAEREQEFRQFAPAPPAVRPPQIDLPAANESRVVSAVAPDSAPAAAAQDPASKRAEDLGEIGVTGSRIRSGNLESTTPATQVTQQDVVGQSQGMPGALMKSSEAVRPPEEWYAEIEKLRSAGKKKEARRELKKLEAAYPGWLEEHLKQEPQKE